jgi:hypothetical protein
MLESPLGCHPIDCQPIDWQPTDSQPTDSQLATAGAVGTHPPRMNLPPFERSHNADLEPTS